MTTPLVEPVLITPPPSRGEATPSLSRPSISEEPSNGISQPRYDEEFWFEDGNLTLISHDVEFRVYRGPLMAKSRVLATLITEAMLSPASAAAPCCHQTVLNVSESPSEVRHFLRALVPGLTLL